MVTTFVASLLCAAMRRREGGDSLSLSLSLSLLLPWFACAHSKAVECAVFREATRCLSKVSEKSSLPLLLLCSTPHICQLALLPMVV